ncbi:MAG: 16S rRNA (guanine(527)-N(7))-methyltransferase RsmG [Erysipelotrichaceae bacterium]|nr:16S rRNA (guanine(527)-N(7))-methyltransferase RsmG [Erysipelotrichaceae bacterium]
MPFQVQDFEKILNERGVVLSELQKEQFATYASMLVEWNSRMNLTAILDINGIYEKHFLDSILPSFQWNMKGTLCDVGAGAGFPSIPLKILYPDLEVTIVEPLGKRITFLNALCEALHIKVNCVNERAEDFAKTHREAFDIVSARAVAPLIILSELCIPLVKHGGIFLSMKAANGDEELQEAKYAIHTLGCTLKDSYQEVLSDGAIRKNYVFEKNKHTPKQYPRIFAKIKKNPLRGGNKDDKRSKINSN